MKLEHGDEIVYCGNNNNNMCCLTDSNISYISLIEHSSMIDVGKMAVIYLTKGIVPEFGQDCGVSLLSNTGVCQIIIALIYL